MKKTFKVNYEDFHKETKKQKKIIDENNFTYKIILKIINKYLVNKKNILDIGCGAGTLCLYYAAKKYNVLGIDISQKAVEAARDSAYFFKLKNAKFEKKIFPTEIPTQKFDLIIFTEVIEHLEDDILALEKIYKLLRPKGIVIISTPSKNAPLYRIGIAKKFDQKVGHLRRYSVEELNLKCKNVGFKILEERQTEGILRNFLYINPLAGKFIRFIKFFLVDIILFIDDILKNIFGESDIFIIAQKP